MVDTKSVYTLSEPRTGRQQIKGAFVTLIVVALVYFLFVSITQIITAPFRILFMSDRQRFAARVNRARAKAKARALARKEFDSSSSNPLYQYLMRFKYSPDQYKNDPMNETYKVWYENLKKGVLVDSGLVWAPDVYENVNGTNILNRSFLDYFSRQFNLHEAVSLGAKLRFMGTINKFYPEFTPKFSVIPSELQDLYARVDSQTLHAEFIKALEVRGVSSDIAEGLIGKESAGDVKAAVRLVQKCRTRNYSKAMTEFCVINNYNPDLHGDELSNAVDNILKNTGNAEIALALIRGDVDMEEIADLINRALSNSSKEDLLSNINREFFVVMKNKTLNLSGR